MADKFGLTGKQDARRLARSVRATESKDLTGESGNRSGNTPAVIQAKVTSNDGAAVASRKYAWSQVRKTSSGSFETAGISGTLTKGFATCPSGIAVATNDIVTLIRVSVNNGDGTFDLSWNIVNPKPGLDLQGSGTTVVTGATVLDIPAASAGVLSFGGSSSHATLSITPPVSGTYKGIYWNGSAWVVDWVRLHS